jgi:hypothetical protein
VGKVARTTDEAAAREPCELIAMLLSTAALEVLVLLDRLQLLAQCVRLLLHTHMLLMRLGPLAPLGVVRAADRLGLLADRHLLLADSFQLLLPCVFQRVHLLICKLALDVAQLELPLLLLECGDLCIVGLDLLPGFVALCAPALALQVGRVQRVPRFDQLRGQRLQRGREGRHLVR